MNKELENKLFEKYKSLFYDDKGKLTLHNRQVECADGWFNLLDDTLLHIKDHSDWKKLITQITQIKEKFSNIRIYVQGGDDSVDAFIALAETFSDSICESCGSNQNIGKTKGWIITLCKSCAEKENKLDRWELKNASNS